MFNESLKPTFERLQKTGVFLTCGKAKPNTMTIGWGGPQIYWGKPIFIVPVRHSRFSYNLLQAHNEFTVSVPAPNDPTLNQALGICGTKSGRDTDKYALAKLELVAGKEVSVPVIGGCEYYFECRTIYQQDLISALMPADVIRTCYPDGDVHRLFFGEIVACYKK